MALYSTFRASSSSAPGDALVVSMSPLIKWERNSTRCSMSSFGYGVAGHVDQLAPLICERVVECQARSPPSGQAVQPIFELAIERVQFRQGIGGGRTVQSNHHSPVHPISEVLVLEPARDR